MIEDNFESMNKEQLIDFIKMLKRKLKSSELESQLYQAETYRLEKEIEMLINDKERLREEMKKYKKIYLQSKKQ